MENKVIKLGIVGAAGRGGVFRRAFEANGAQIQAVCDIRTDILEKSNVLIRNLSAAGLFGQPYYAEGEYLHDCRALNEDTPWRRRWQTGIEGCTYGTHSLGPILQWMPGDRVAKVCVAGSGSHHQDP